MCLVSLVLPEVMVEEKVDVFTALTAAICKNIHVFLNYFTQYWTLPGSG